MCPACMAAAAVIAAKATTAGGLTAFVVKKMRSKPDAKPKTLSHPVSPNRWRIP